MSSSNISPTDILSLSDNAERSVVVFSSETIELCITDRMQGKVRNVRTVAEKIREGRVRHARVKDTRALPGVVVRYGGRA